MNILLLRIAVIILRKDMKDSEKIVLLKEIVSKQAEDEGLWFDAEHCSEAYLQEALRYLHGIIEG